jgi:glycosyltransferase involved in cell wall biosynthesis
VDDFALQLERVLNEPKLRTALAQNAREFVQAYSWKNVARQYEELFNELRSTPKEVSQSGRDQKKP